MNDIITAFGGGRVGAINPDAAFMEMERAADDWTEAEYKASLLEEQKKIMLAQIFEDKEGSVASREQQVLADPAYATHIEGMVAARREANRTKARFYNLKALAEMRRTAEVSARGMTS